MSRQTETVHDVTDIDDVIEPYVDENTDETIDASGTSPQSFSLPDDSPRVQLIAEIQQAVREEIERERRQWAGLSKNTMKVDQNVSGEILFTRFTVGTQAVQICREKQNRGRVIIRIVPGTEGSVSVGRHVGIIAGGADTMTVYSDATDMEYVEREIRTLRSLWAIASADTQIEVIEEFD